MRFNEMIIGVLPYETETLFYNTVRIHKFLEENKSEIPFIDRKILAMFIAELKFGDSVKNIYYKNGVTLDVVLGKYNLVHDELFNIDLTKDEFENEFYSKFLTPFLITQNYMSVLNTSNTFPKHLFFNLNFEGVIGSKVVSSFSTKEIRNDLCDELKNNLVDIRKYKKDII